MTILEAGVQMPPDADPLKVVMVEDDLFFQSNFVAAIEAAPV